MKQLSIIIPVYNVEKYIRVCLESIFCQGMDEDLFEVIIVNDGTKDNSMGVIDDIIHNHKNIIVINQSNQGLSIARNNGITKACGEYLLFVDSDDLLTKDSLSLLLENAIKTKADLIIADFLKMSDQDILENYEKPALEKAHKTEEKTGWQVYIEDFNPRECYVWRFLFRRRFLYDNNITFIPSICFEDIPFIHESYLKANKCIRIHQTFYIYRVGNSSISNRINLKKGMDFGTAIANTWKLTQLKNLSPEILQRLIDNIFISFSALLYGISHEVPSLSDRKRILKHLMKTEPNLIFSNGIKQRLVYFIYKTAPYLYIEIRVLCAKYIERNIRY